MSDTAHLVNALTLHKERIRLLQEQLCECSNEQEFRGELHEPACPVYAVAVGQRMGHQAERDSSYCRYCGAHPRYWGQPCTSNQETKRD